ncbi:MAG TPA: sigma-70 family RNA polymerase sigma factor [Candidatus Eisenbacteria bacterium]|nr:sigma-70 family RNA polymerase sigma factor [Candidatus Eisenbacteria bacterium]
MEKESPEAVAALIDRIARQDRKAFSRLYDLYAPFVFSFALRLVRLRPDAEELLQDVFLQVWNQAARYDASRGKPEAWLSNITKSRAIDKLRSVRRRDVGAESFGRFEETTQGERVERADAAADARLLAGGALQKLPEDQKKALELSYFEGLTHEEIAEALGVPLGTIKTRIRAGLKRLREMVA